MPIERNVDIVLALQAAQPGAVLTCQLIPQNNVGALRVTYNWLYSALNCDPNDTSPFYWVMSKIGSGSNVSLSPQQGYEGWTLYASVRPDLDYTVQVQAPFSADWIKAVAGDETLIPTDLGFLTIAFQGVNGKYLSVDGTETPHDGHSGYLVHSSADAPGPSTNFFAAVNQLHQNVDIALVNELDFDDVVTALASRGVANPQAMARTILSLKV